MVLPVADSSARVPAQKNRSLRLHLFLQRRERIAIARRGCVLRDAECFGDLRESQFIPNFHDQNFALIARQVIDRRGKFALRIVAGFKLRFDRSASVCEDFDFTSGAPLVASNEIEGCRADGRIEQSAIVDAMIAAPKAHKRILNNIFCICRGAHPLSGKKYQPRRELRKTNFPIFMSGDILHDPFTVFTFETPPTDEFVCHTNHFLRDWNLRSRSRFDGAIWRGYHRGTPSRGDGCRIRRHRPPPGAASSSARSNGWRTPAGSSEAKFGKDTARLCRISTKKHRQSAPCLCQ